MKKILTCCSLIIAGALVAAAFITATSYTQLAVAILFYPVFVYFTLQAFPRTKKASRSKKQVETAIQSPEKPLEKIEPAKEGNMIGITDIDKRVFLKLIGSVGVSLFLFSIFNKRAEGLFFKNIPAQGTSGQVSLEDIAGNKIDPAQNHPMDGYRISEIDDDLISFYGSTHKNGSWYIMRIDTDKGSFRYAKGDSNFPGNWSNRKNLRYDYYNNIF